MQVYWRLTADLKPSECHVGVTRVHKQGFGRVSAPASDSVPHYIFFMKYQTSSAI